MKIVVPMDFTLVGANAFKYAYRLYPGAEISCLYCLTTDSVEKMMPSRKGDTRTSLLTKELEHTVLRVLEVETLPERISIHVLPGEAVSTIKEFAKELNPDYIVMGTRDKYDVFDKWLGTVSLGLIKSSDFPIYLVPRHASYHDISKVLVAADNHLVNNKLIDWLRNWNKPFKAFMKFLHVQQSEQREVESIAEGIVSNLFEEHDAEFGFEIENVKSKDLSGTLLAKAYNLGADLIITVPSKQSLLQSLLFKSTSKELVMKTKIPILFLKFYE